MFLAYKWALLQNISNGPNFRKQPGSITSIFLFRVAPGLGLVARRWPLAARPDVREGRKREKAEEKKSEELMTTSPHRHRQFNTDNSKFEDLNMQFEDRPYTFFNMKR